MGLYSFFFFLIFKTYVFFRDAFANNLSVAVLRNGVDGFDMSDFLLNTAQQQYCSDYHVVNEEAEARQVTDTIIRYI